MQQTKISPFTVFYEHGEEFHRLKNEIFTQGIYYFETNSSAPRILDAGAHIGLATLYFKKLYPTAKITALEPLPQNFALLEKNIFENQLTTVDLHQIALADQTGEADFFFDTTDQKWFSTASFSSGAWNHQQQSQKISVQTQTLAYFLKESVDFLKMDIEGAEQRVIESTGEKIKNIQHMIVEFHPTVEQSLPHLVHFLEDQHFRVDLWQNGKKVVLQPTKKLLYIEAKQK